MVRNANRVAASQSTLSCSLAVGRRHAPPVAADVPVKAASPNEQVVAGMLVRTPGSQVVYYVDKHMFRRKIPSMQVFHRLFGTRHYDIVTLPERTVLRLRAGEPLV